MTGTRYLAAAAQCSSLSNGGAEYGPFGLSVPCLSQNAVVAVPEVQVEDLVDRGLCLVFPEHRHYTFSCARSVKHPSENFWRLHRDLPSLEVF